MLAATSWRKDGLPNKTFSVMMIVLLFISVTFSAIYVQLAEADIPTVYINADGSISPSSAPIHTSDDITYVFTGNVSYPNYYGIVVQRSNITVDGNGYTVQGNQSGCGLNLTGISNVIIKRINLSNFSNGIVLDGSSYNTITGDNATESGYDGIYFYSSSNNTVSANCITANNEDGIYFNSFSDNNTISGNNIATNKVDGILFLYSSGGSVVGNNIANQQYGIWLSSSSGNNIVGNNITANTNCGIELQSSSNYNSIHGNAVTNDGNGIYLTQFSNNNVISENNATANSQCGIAIYFSGNNIMCHNNFANNTKEAQVNNSTGSNSWDEGYPSGGNYWSDYTGTDSHSGPYQNVTGSDGIGDTPYIIGGFNTDHYPLMQPWTGPAQTSTHINLSISLMTVGSAVTCTATVSGANAGTRATGTVTWSTSSSTGSFGTPVCTLSSGSCYTVYNDSRPGSETIAAYYSGDSNYQPSSGSTTLTVVSSGSVYYSQNYGSVQAAINASSPGSNLIVAPGFYSERLILDKKLTIIGDPDQAEFGGGGSGIFLTVFSGASGAIVTGFEITSYDEGILVYASNCQIYSNTMSSMSESGIVLDGSSATGDVVCDNVFQNTPTAINLTDSAASNTIYGNIISSQATVTLSVGTNDNTVYQNVISGSSVIVNMASSTGNTFYHDDFLATTEIVATGTNTWDDGSSGNYWSDYLTKCPNAAEVDSSGIWNTSYVINGNNQDNYPLMSPFAPSVGHDAAVTLVVSTKTVIMQGYTGSVTVAVFNRGQYTETFLVTAYGNNTTIGTQQVSGLGSVGQATLTFTWNTIGYAIGKYTINAYADPVQGETDVANNNFTDGLIYVSMVGDLTGATPFVPDGKCDGRDITVVAKCFGSGLGSPRYNPNCDILNRGKIDGRDITIVAKNFGKHEP